MRRTLMWAPWLAVIAGGLGVTPAPLAAQASDTVYSGCGGGKTGGGGGLIVAADGSIARWRRNRAGQPRTVIETWTDTAGAARLFRVLYAARFRSLPRGKPSNWTCFFRLVDSAGTHEVLYSGPLPPALREIDSLTKALARTVKGPEASTR